MSHEPKAIDASILDEWREVLDLLTEFIAKEPQKNFLRQFAMVDLLRRGANMVGRRDLSPAAMHRVIGNDIRKLLRDRRPDGIPTFVLPDRIISKLQSLHEKAVASSDK